ncbi:MAG TPA: aldehyde dehydrogenase family protein, partial [Streptosporangiaceae bacterium]
MAADLATITGMSTPTGLLIGGHWSAGRAGSLRVIDPATEDPIADVANATPEDALDAVGAASQALPGWAATPPRVRGECLRRAYELMIA